MNATRERAIEQLREMVLTALGAHDAAAWLFGSCARDETRQHSDIDIAILPRDELPDAFLAMLTADIEESTIPYDVDLVDLRHADEGLIDEIRREGVKWRE
jgi:predicted nucleotidyltransferase